MEHDKTPQAPAAQDDVLGEAMTNKGVPPNASAGKGGQPGAGAAKREPGDGEAAPGKDENQAGFLHDRDKRYSP